MEQTNVHSDNDLEDVALQAIEEDIKAGAARKGPRFVAVTVDNVEHHVRRGRYVVSQFKRLVRVEPTYQLEQVVNGEFKPLEDDQKVRIRGREAFVSHPRGGAAS